MKPSLSRCLSMILALAVCVPAAKAQARTGDEFGPPELRIPRELAWNHALRLERERQVLVAWLEASPKERGAIEDALGLGREEQRSRRRPVPLNNLSKAWRGYISGPEDPSRMPWLNLLDSTDLRVIPGAFNARTEGRGEPLTVMITSIWKDSLDGLGNDPLEIRLVWTAPDGGETVVRREVAEAGNFQSGFSMYLRPPLSKPGLWWLALELDSPEGVIRTRPVPVECLEDLPGLLTELRAAASTPTGHLQKSILNRLDPLLGYGLRRASTHPLENWVNWSRSKPGSRAGITPLDGELFGAPGTTFWQLTETATEKGALLILAKDNESPLDVFNGPRQAQWAALGKACGLRVIAVQLPISSTSLEPLDACLAALDGEDGEGPLVLVTRGESGRVLPYLLAQFPQPGLDAVVMTETIGAGARLSTALPAPVLQITTGLYAPASELQSEGAGASLRSRLHLRVPEPVASYLANKVIQDWILSL